MYEYLKLTVIGKPSRIAQLFQKEFSIVTSIIHF